MRERVRKQHMDKCSNADAHNDTPVIQEDCPATALSSGETITLWTYFQFLGYIFRFYLILDYT